MKTYGAYEIYFIYMRHIRRNSTCVYAARLIYGRVYNNAKIAYVCCIDGYFNTSVVCVYS